MAPADFTLDFFKLCLSQHVWGWRDLADAFDRQKHSSGEDFLLHVAYANGQPFIDAFNAASPQQTFPFNLTEKPNTKPKTNMTPIQITINVPEFEKLADAINNLSAALPWSYGTMDDPKFMQKIADAYQAKTHAHASMTVSTSGGESEATAPAKKRGRPAKVEETPAAPAAPAVVEEPAPAPAVEAEVEPALPEQPELTGADLARKATELFSGEEPIKVAMRKKLVDFRTNVLGWNQPITKLTDQAALYQFNEQMDLLADEMAAAATSPQEEEV